MPLIGWHPVKRRQFRLWIIRRHASIDLLEANFHLLFERTLNLFVGSLGIGKVDLDMIGGPHRMAGPPQTAYLARLLPKPVWILCVVTTDEREKSCDKQATLPRWGLEPA